MALLPPLFVFLFLFLILMPVRSQGDTTSFQFHSFDPDSKDLTYERDALVPSDSNFLRLTNTNVFGRPQPLSVGRVLYSNPVQFWEPGRQASFSTTITFSITSDSSPADGLTFFIVPVDSTISSGGVGGNLGIFDAVVAGSPIFAVEFDIFINTDVDPSFRHIGIDINSRKSENVTRFDNAIGQVVTAIINYDATTNAVRVVATYGSQTATVSYVVDLKDILPQQVQVGISSATGFQFAIHDIYSWYFTSTLVWEEGSSNNNIKQYV